jgi:hypothetical protein
MSTTPGSCVCPRVAMSGSDSPISLMPETARQQCSSCILVWIYELAHLGILIGSTRGRRVSIWLSQRFTCIVTYSGSGNASFIGRDKPQIKRTCECIARFGLPRPWAWSNQCNILESFVRDELFLPARSTARSASCASALK